MNTITRWEPSRGVTSLQDQVNRFLEDTLTRGQSGQADEHGEERRHSRRVSQRGLDRAHGEA